MSCATCKGTGELRDMFGHRMSVCDCQRQRIDPYVRQVVYEREAEREHVEIQDAELQRLRERVRELETLISQMADGCEAEAKKAREAALEEAAAIVSAAINDWADNEADGYLEPVFERIRALKGAT